LTLGWKKLGIMGVLVVAGLLVGLIGLGMQNQSTEAALQTPGGISAFPSGLPGIPFATDQILPAIAPASGPGANAVVTVWCDFVAGCPFDIVTGDEFPIDLEITRAYPPGDPAATFAVTGGTTMNCLDGATCDLNIDDDVISVEVDGGGVNEVVDVTGCDRAAFNAQGDCRTVSIIFVETIFAVSPLNSGTASDTTLVSYRCDDVGLETEFDMDDVWNDLYDDFNLVDDGLDSDLGLYPCGGDTSSPLDDRVNFETDAGILSVEEFGDLAVALNIWTIHPACDAGDSVDVLDSPSWVGTSTGSQLCDVDYAPNGVVTYGLLGTGDVGVATITAQQSGGGAVLRTINTTFAGIAALQLFITAPASVGLTGADFSTVIVDMDGRPIAGETVECSVSPTGGALVVIPQTGTSDANGEVAFQMIPTGASVVAGEELTINCHLDSNPDVKASTTVNLSSTPDLEAVALVEGCNPVASTWPDGTAAADAAAQVAPAEALEAIWNFDAASGTWQGFSPDAPADVSDLEEIGFLDAIFVCVSEAATWSRPVI
jgi:hypothetical protein